MTSALQHLRILELGDSPACACCGRQFALWGADVQVLEPAGGSSLRAAPPMAATPGGPVSCTFEFLAAGKRSLVLTDDVDLSALAAGAHVLITDWPAPALEQRGLSLHRLRELVPSLVVVHLSPFGLSGPYAGEPATDLGVQAVSGYLSLQGAADAAPLKAPRNLVPYLVGVSAFVGALAQVWKGGSDLVEVAAMEALASILPVTRTEYSGRPGRRGGNAVSILPVGDGHLSVKPRGTVRVLQAAGAADTSVPEALQAEDDAPAALAALMAERTRGASVHEVFDRLLAGGAPAFGKFLDLTGILADRHLAALDFFVDQPHPRLPRARMAGPPGRLSKTPALPLAAAPALGEGGAPWPARPQRPMPADTRRPLAGLRVVDLTQAWIGPYAALLVADLGADLIKVESHHRPDVWRGARAAAAPGWRPPANARPRSHPANLEGNFNSVNRNKRSLTLDFNHADGKRLFLELVRRADVVMENYTPRVMAKFGFDYATLARVRPDLVMASFSGYGAAGPYASYKANGTTIEAIGGWDALFGYPGGPPRVMGFYQADAITGLHMAAMTLVALVHRKAGGGGQAAEGSMMEAAVGYLGEELLFAAHGGDTPRIGNRHPAMAPHGVFRCGGDDRWLALAVRDDRDWQALVEAAGGDALRSARWASAPGRLADVDAVEEAVGRFVADATASADADALAVRLRAAGIPAWPVHDMAEMLRDPPLNARCWFERLTHPDMGTHRYTGFPWRFGNAHLHSHTPPRLGEHSRAILRRELGLDAGAVVALFDAGVTGEVFELEPVPASRARQSRQG